MSRLRRAEERYGDILMKILAAAIYERGAELKALKDGGLPQVAKVYWPAPAKINLDAHSEGAYKAACRVKLSRR